MNAQTTRLIALVGAIAVAAAFRLVPHPSNFTPIGAMALFSGAYLGRRNLALVAPLGALLLSDLALGFYDGMWVQYVATALAVAIGWLLLWPRSGALRIAGAAFASALLFFVITNLGTWATSGMYSHDGAGLAACYLAALPFFGNSLAGDLFYAILLFGGFALAERMVPQLRAGATLPA